MLLLDEAGPPDSPLMVGGGWRGGCDQLRAQPPSSPVPPPAQLLPLDILRVLPAPAPPLGTLEGQNQVSFKTQHNAGSQWCLIMLIGYMDGHTNRWMETEEKGRGGWKDR